MDRRWISLGALCALAIATPAAADPSRDTLVTAAFVDRDRAQALAHIDRAYQGASTLLARAPNDQDALLVQATARGYRAKLNSNRSEAIATRKIFETLAARFPRNPEAQVALGSWHVGLVAKFGGLASRIAVGAQKGVGLAALDRAVALGGDRAMFLGLAGLLRVQLDPRDPRGIQLTEAAVRGSTPTAIDRILQRAAATVLVPLRRGDRKGAQALAERVLPLGQFGG